MKISKSMFFSGAAAVGVVATFLLTIKSTKDADEKITELKEETEDPTTFEIVKTVVPAYAPAVIIGLATILCIFESSYLNKKQQAALSSAYILANQSHKKYKDKVKELYGEEAHNRIMEELAVEKAKEQELYADGLIGRYSNTDMYNAQDTRLFYDVYSNRYFESTVGAVLDAEYRLNRNYVLRGHVTLNEFYDFLGVNNVEKGDILGWDCRGDMEGIWWLDFEHRVTNVGGNTGKKIPCIIIDMTFEPHLLDESLQWK